MIKVVIGIIAIAALATGGAYVLKDFLNKNNPSVKLKKKPPLTNKHWELLDLIEEMQSMYEIMDEYYRTHK